MAKESSFKNMVICLTAVCLLCSAVLAVVYVITMEPIQKAQIEKTNNAIAGVVPEFDNFPSEDKFEIEMDGKKYVIYPAKKGEEIVAYAIESVSTKGFGGPIKLIVGFTLDGTIFNTAVLSHTETPGLGEKMVASKSDFSLQFKGKNPQTFKLAVKKDGGDIDAITASTISSRAFADAVELAYKAFCSLNANPKNN